MRVLTEAEEPLHWTVIQDRALRAGYLDPFETPDVRAAVLGRASRGCRRRACHQARERHVRDCRA